MNNQQFLDRLRKALSGLDRGARDEILREIESHASETGGSASLETQFGDPETLALQYLDGAELPPTVGKRAGRVGRTILLGLGGITLAWIALVIGVTLFAGSDEFDYSDEQSSELQEQQRNWNQQPWNDAIRISVDQAKAVFYWHSDASLKWDCDGASDFTPETGGELSIRHGRCFVYLPSVDVEINADQSSIVLVRPQSSAKIDAHQASVRIAEKGQPYRYQMELNRSNRGGFSSSEASSIVIAVRASESTVEPYEYD